MSPKSQSRKTYPIDDDVDEILHKMKCFSSKSKQDLINDAVRIAYGPCMTADPEVFKKFNDLMNAMFSSFFKRCRI